MGQDDKLTMAGALVKVARGEIGVEEEHGSNCGPRVNEYKKATWLDHTKGWPWCAAFVCWCVMMAAQRISFRWGNGLERPRTAGAWDFENWCREQDNRVKLHKPAGEDIKAGDIVCFTFSHIGIATSAPDSNGYVRTCEGNTDDAGSREGGCVAEKIRHVSKIRSRIRFMV